MTTSTSSHGSTRTPPGPPTNADTPPKHGAPADPLTPDGRRRWTRVGVLAALALALGYLESFVPIPIPGVRLGLANVAVIVALAAEGTRAGVAVATIKVLAGSLVLGSPVTLAYSAAGTALSVTVMAALIRLPTMHIAMASVAGAVAHEAAQLLVARLMLGTDAVWYAAPALMTLGAATGALCGMLAATTLRELHTPNTHADAWAAHLWSGVQGTWLGGATSAHAASARETNPNAPGPARTRCALVLLIAYVLTMLHVDGAPLGIGLGIGLIAAAYAHVSAARIARSARSLAAIALVGVIAQAAVSGSSSAVSATGLLSIAGDALIAAAAPLARLVGITAASLAFAHATATDNHVGVLTWALTPLADRGMSVAGLTLATDVALRVAPLLVAAVGWRAGAPDGKRARTPTARRESESGGRRAEGPVDGHIEGTDEHGQAMRLRDLPSLVAAAYRAADAVT